MPSPAGPVLWVGGWASGLACWRGELERLYPDRRHAFLDAHEILERPSLLLREAERLPPEGVLAAWSLGSLLVHAALASETFRPVCRVLSLSPIFDFCGEEGAWPRAVLARMIRRLPKARAAVLDEFWTQVKGSSPVTPELEAAWKAQSRSYSLDALVAGLEALAGTRVERASLHGVTFLAGRSDPLAPAPRGVSPGAEWVLYAGGHLPFFDHPGLVSALIGGGGGGGGA